MKDLSKDEIKQFTKDHVFWTWSAQASVNPIQIKNAKGVYFWDLDGKKYIDLNSMTMCVNVGHGEDYIVNAITRQAHQLTYASPGMTSDVRAYASKLISEISPGKKLTKVLFTLGGADSNENAMKLARGYTGKFKILTRYRSYHGATAGSMAATGDPRRWFWEPLNMPGIVHFLDPYRYRSTFHRLNQDINELEFSTDYLNHLEEIIQYEGPGTIAGILIESVTGTNGIIIPPEGYLQGVRDLCTKYGIVMIADEVMSGFGRTGKWFAVDHWGVVPDIVTMAKGLTSGYAPLGAVAMKPEISAAFDKLKFESGLTYTAHPISLAAAIANIEIMKEKNIIENASRMGTVLRNLLLDMEKKHKSIGEIRSIGLFGVIELVKSRKTREPMASWNSTSQVMTAIQNYCLENGLYLYTHWHTILIIPPLIISESELTEAFKIIDGALKISDAACK
jgi:taurine---2-oxoglutarate transaminase